MAEVVVGEAVLPAEVEGYAVGAEHDAGDGAVAGRPAGLRRGDDRTGSEGGGAPAGGGVGEVVEVDARSDVWLDRPHRQQVAGGEVVVARLHEGVAEALGAGALIAGWAVDLGGGLERNGELLATDGVGNAADRQAAVGVPRQGQRPLFGGSGSGPSGSGPSGSGPSGSRSSR
ncbi:syndecan 1 [Geodermatophilus amargosae]|uniref:Syndecan 1 n=1 Tax=Geodermatophilus amargosae TaxID=1296565 RepID=A0A1I6YNC9_9ACTN|nr:syndecan 1 [Geodermatophilus amargosae]